MVSQKFGKKRWEAIKETCKDQLSQGLSVQKISLSISIGFIVGISPFPGTTTLVCFIFAYLFRLNHIIIQSVNFSVYPLQLLLLVPFYKFGNIWFEKVPISLPDFNSFKFTLGNIFSILQKSAINAIILWLLTALPITIGIYFISRKLLKAYHPQRSGKNASKL
jgi:uncharacterized protein (DUF2062 family)